MSNDLQKIGLNLANLSRTLVEQDKKRQDAFDLSRQMQVALFEAKHALDTNQETDAAIDNLVTLFQNPLIHTTDAASSRTPRLANLSGKMEDYVRFLAYRHFLKTAQLLPPPANVFTDEEYLAGAVMGLCQDLAHYGLGCATVRNVEAVKAAARLVAVIMDYLLQLDFRNGPLRRKYDGTKYTLKTLETFLYELAVTGANIVEESAPDTKLGIGSSKKIKMDLSALLLPAVELDAMKQRMAQRDEMRETLIKSSRDGQKAAKQAIFALHRGDHVRATELLQQCLACITKQLLPIVEQEPPLRGGSFANVLEEYAEAKLFAVWLSGADSGTAATVPSGILLESDQFGVHLEAEEYLGGLCDLTGEIGRYAVQRGTVRDTAGVQLCLQTNSSIILALHTVERLPHGIGKKMEMVRRSVEKLERMLYELSLSEAAGGRAIASEAPPENDAEE